MGYGLASQIKKVRLSASHLSSYCLVQGMPETIVMRLNSLAHLDFESKEDLRHGYESAKLFVNEVLKVDDDVLKNFAIECESLAEACLRDLLGSRPQS
jgi:hypothetical protein